MNEYLIIAIGGVVLLLIYYIFTRELQQNRQIRAIATAIEQLNHQVYTLEQSLKERSELKVDDDSLTAADLQYELEVGFSEYSKPIIKHQKELQDELTQIKEQLQQRITNLEENVRNLSLPASVTGMDDDRIITLYKQGVDLDTISKELRLSKPEVEFVLKINKLK
jgi:gas vesicle protein